MLPNAFKWYPKCCPGRRSPILCVQNALIVLLCLLVFLMTGLPGPPIPGAWAEDLDKTLNDPDVPWHIVADRLSYDDQAKVYIAEGDVEITKADKKITADNIRFDHDNMQVEASGNIVVFSGEDKISAENLNLDLETEKGQLSNSRIFLKRNNFHIWASELQKTGPETYRAEKASVTTCDGDKPDWKITGRNLNVTIEGYGYASHAAFWVKNVPIFYSPWVGFPVKTQRQTGLLTPWAGYSNRKGYQYSQPFFWAISQSSDATLYWHAMTERGNKFGAEYRYSLSPLSKGTTMFDFLEDRRIDSVTGDDTQGNDWGYEEDDGDDILRTNSDRYWFRTKNNQELPGRFNALLDLDIVSDQDYLTEFKRGHMGFRETSRYYNAAYGRSLDDYNDPVRLNRFNINRSWSRFNLNGEVRWFDDVVARTQDLDDTTVQRLPVIRFTGSKQAAGNTPFLYDLNTSYTYFYRENATTSNSVTQDHRFDVHPRLYLPLNLGPYLTFEPSLGLRETIWKIQAFDTPPQDSDTDDFLHREIYDVGAVFSSEVYRIFNTGRNRLKHTMTPRVTYSYIPDEDQTAYPEFDSIDRIEPENRITYSLTNLFVLRRLNSRPMEQQDDPPVYRYHQMARFDIGQTYDIREAREDDPLEWNNGETQEPFSPIFARLDITPEEYFRLSAQADWSIYDRETVNRSLAAILSDLRGNRLAIAHQFSRETDSESQDGVDSFVADGTLRVTRPLSLTARYERDLYTDKDLETSFGILYASQCWSLKLNYTKDVDEIIYSFEIALNGLGSIGTGIAQDDIASSF
jgi:LPS-assembly protein